MSKVVYITGCTSGFGKELVQQFLEQGHKVIATARNTSKLSLPQSENLRIQQLDVTDAPDTLHLKAQEALEFFGHVDILLNNAGYASTGCVEEASPEQWRDVFACNVFGPINLTKAFLPHMRSKKEDSVICQISSVVGISAMPTNAPYSASKAAVESVFENLSQELRDVPKVRVLIIEPGCFNTEAFKNYVKPAEQIEDYAGIRQQIQSAYSDFGALCGDLEVACRRILDAILREGLAESRTIPLRVALGGDAVTQITQKYTKEAASAELWRDFSASTDEK